MTGYAPLGTRGACLLAGLAFAVPVAAAEQPDAVSVQCTGQSISVQANEARIKDILAQLARACGVNIVLQEPIGDERLSMDARQVAPQRVLKTLLRRYSFLLRYSQPAPEKGNWLGVYANSADPAGPGEIIRPVAAMPALEAIYLLGENTDGPIAATLADALANPDRDVREAAAETLGDFGTDAAALALAVVLNDPDPEIRQTTVDALGRIGGAASTQLLRQFLADSDPVVREAAADNLAELHGDL